MNTKKNLEECVKIPNRFELRNSSVGGHLFVTHVDSGILIFLKKKFNLKTMIDIGCGPGGMEKIAQKNNVKWTGIDGDKSVLDISSNIKYCDFEKGTLNMNNYDLAWSVEFLEHVYEKYQHNYMNLFNKCKYVVCTAAPPGKPGYHHVNCRTTDYWIDVFSKYGFTYDENITNECKKYSTMKKEFFRKWGMFFVKQNL